MKKTILAVLCAALFGACTSVESATVSGSEVAANGEAIAVIQGTALGFSAILYMIDIVSSDLDTVVNKLLVAEAKAMGASKVDLKYATTTPRHGIFALTGLILGFPMSQAQGVAVK